MLCLQVPATSSNNRSLLSTYNYFSTNLENVLLQSEENVEEKKSYSFEKDNRHPVQN